MTWTTLEEYGNSSLKGIMQFPSQSFAWFWPLILSAIFLVVTFSSYFAEKEKTGKGNFLSSLAVAGFVNIALSLVLSILEVIDRTTLIISFIFSIIFIVIYMLTE